MTHPPYRVKVVFENPKLNFEIYSQDIIDIYTKDRATNKGTKKGKIDHGIIGGLLLYERLRENFENTWNACNKNTSRCNRKDFYVNGSYGKRLHFSENHFEQYNRASNAIIAHNIFRETLNQALQKQNITLFD